MSQHDLKDLLAKVHAELSDIEELDAESASMLATVVDDIHAVLGDDEVVAEPHGFIEQLKEAAQDLEEEYPRLTQAVGRVADALARMGI